MRILPVLLCLICVLRPASAWSATCIANDYATLARCIAPGTTVELAADITLGIDEQVSVVDVDGLVIDGRGHTISETREAYLATGLANTVMFRVQRASNVALRNLRLRSPASQRADCRSGGSYYLKAPCLGAIAIVNSATVVLDGIDIDMEKTFLVQVSGSADVSIGRSQFRNAATYGIWTSRFATQRLAITGSYFEGVGANAIMLNSVRGATISGNHFYGNHTDTQFSGFGGGQVALEDVGDYLEGIDIVDNLFQGGNAPYAMGIEFAHFDDAVWVSGQIRGNRIENHAASGIKLNIRDADSDLRQLVIADNQLVDNFVYQGSQIEVNGHAFVDIDSNPQTNGDLTRNGSFRGSQRSCRLHGQARCTVELSWSSSGLVDPRIYVRSSRFGGSRYLLTVGASGVMSFPWVDGSGGVFELIEGDSAQPIASITVRAEP